MNEGMSHIKKTIIGLVTTAVTAAGAYVTTHVNELFGIEEDEPAQTEQVEAAPAQVEQKSEQNVNVAGPEIIINVPQQQPQQTRVIERVIEKPVAAPAPSKKVEVESEEDPW